MGFCCLGSRKERGKIILVGFFEDRFYYYELADVSGARS